jgi:glycosyltransferase involved in cell wall biosynthesis
MSEDQKAEIGSADSPLLSIIVPAYNEQKRLPDSLSRIASYVRAQSYPIEVLVVDDGSGDETAGVVEEMAENHPFVTLVRNPHRGKGYAVKTGMLRANGQYLFFGDADLSMPIEEIQKFLPGNLGEYDVAIGSREAPGANRYDEPPLRHLMGRVFNLLVQLLAVRGFRDTQCGYKGFRREVARDIFSAQTMDGFGFDVEILFVAQKRRYRMVEVPIEWYHKGSSQVNPVKDTFKMIRDVFQVRWNDWRGQYEKR